jgi:glutathione S-transferase
MLKIYGNSMSRAGRTLWAAEELGLKFEVIPKILGTDTRKPDYLKINPNGHVPAIDDDGVILWESMAINLYLAEKYGKAPLWPSSVADHGRCYQWSVWAMTEVEPHVIAIFQHKMMLPKEQRSEEVIAKSIETLKAPFNVLNQQLSGRDYLLGKDFTIADLNVASVTSIAPMVGIDFSAVPAAKAWLDRCTVRPASAKSRQYR